MNLAFRFQKDNLILTFHYRDSNTPWLHLGPHLSPKAARACASTRVHWARIMTSLTFSVLSMGRIDRLAIIQMHVGNAPALALEATGDATDT